MAKEYKVVTEDTAHQLQDSVNFWIKHGWTPSGNMAIKPEGGFLSLETTEFCQAMIKEDK